MHLGLTLGIGLGHCRPNVRCSVRSNVICVRPGQTGVLLLDWWLKTKNTLQSIRHFSLLSRELQNHGNMILCSIQNGGHLMYKLFWNLFFGGCGSFVFVSLSSSLKLISNFRSKLGNSSIFIVIRPVAVNAVYMPSGQ